jgi:hypothetical protein
MAMSESMKPQLEQWHNRNRRLETWSILGLAITVGISTLVGGRSWDANALLVERASFDTSPSTAAPLSKLSTDTQTIFLDVEIRNKTGRDITLPPSVKVRETTIFSPSLKLSEFGMNGPVVLRAGGSTKIRISYDLYCKVGRVRKDCVRRALGDIDQIILFDGLNNFEIRVPLASAMDAYLASPN